ncbi:MAG TPA: hypothetical protein VH478_11955 [Trebonia sp.]|jgi:hypothetical protein|nr:hypothetical protein [Trebonia sp.]
MADLIPLPGGSWRLWCTVPLRSGGFPVRLVDRLADPVLAEVADGAAGDATVDVGGGVAGAELRVDPESGEIIEVTELRPQARRHQAKAGTLVFMTAPACRITRQRGPR